MQDFLFIQIGKKHSKLFFSEIIYIESLKNYVQIVTGRNKYMIKITIRSVEAVLPKEKFCRIHRSYIVALNTITDFTNEYLQIPGKKLPLGEQYKKLLFDRVITIGSESRSVTKNNNKNNIIKGFGLN